MIQYHYACCQLYITAYYFLLCLISLCLEDKLKTGSKCQPIPYIPALE